MGRVEHLGMRGPKRDISRRRSSLVPKIQGSSHMLRGLVGLQRIDRLDGLHFMRGELAPPVDRFLELVVDGLAEFDRMPSGRFTPDTRMQTEQAVNE